MKEVILSNGMKMPILGFGVYQITNKEECEQAVLDALEAGYRLIDTAASYQNEEAVGNAIKRSGIKREEIFLTTKLWVSDATYEGAKASIERQLKLLDTPYIDLYLIHQPFNDVYGAWRAMSEAVKEGKLKAIGISNFRSDRLVDFCINNEVKPVVNQIEINPFNQNVEEVNWMNKYNVQAEAWAPFAEGRNDIFNNPTLKAIGDKYNKSIAQVIVRWLIQRDIVVLCKSANKTRIIENFNVFDFNLNDEDMSLISKLDTLESQFFSHYNPAVVERINNLHR